MAGDSGVEPGNVVWANLEDGRDRDDDVLVFVKQGEHKVDGELKATVQAPNGKAVDVGYREPDDPNNADPDDRGLTFWLVK